MLKALATRIRSIAWRSLIHQASRWLGARAGAVVQADRKRSRDLGLLWGTPVTVRPSFAAILLLLTIAHGWTVVPLGFVSLMLHEYGHIFRARAHGIKTERITLTAGGAAAEMLVSSESFLIRPHVEREIGAVGPLVSFALSAVGYAAAAACVLVGIPEDAALLFGQLNLVLASFNMMPILPMDGGRVVRGIILQESDSWEQKARILRISRQSEKYSFAMIFALTFISPFVGILLLTQFGHHKNEVLDSIDYCERRQAQEEAAEADRRRREREAWAHENSKRARRGYCGSRRFSFVPRHYRCGWWEDLGLVASPSSLKEVKAAYRKKTFECHPDRGGRPEEMRRVARAYEIGKSTFG